MLLWFACADDTRPSATPPASGPVDIAAGGWARGDLHFHTNYSDDALEQGGDWMALALSVADAWRDPLWVEAHPELAPTDHLQFVAVTDHRTMDGMADPDFVHPYLTLIPGEEFGSDGHAGIWGHQAHIPHDPVGAESQTQRLRDAIGEAHGQGGLFSVNHPLYAGDLWAWDTPGFDAVEVWNGPWSSLGVPTDEATLDAWLAERGATENPYIRPAVREGGVVQNAQALRFWYEVLSSGVLVPPVGGGDRHMLFPAGFPTTYVLGAPADALDGIRSGHTFVSRSPQGPQVVLQAEVAGERFDMGSALPGGPVSIAWRVGRASGGELRFVGAPLGGVPAVLATFELDAADVSGSWTWSPPAAGGWVHALVLDPLPTDLPPALAAAADSLVSFPSEDGALALLAAVGPLMDLDLVFDPTGCDPGSWGATGADCMPVDAEPYGTFYLSTELQGLMSADFAGGAPTGLAMGAISAAFLAPTQL